MFSLLPGDIHQEEIYIILVFTIIGLILIIFGLVVFYYSRKYRIFTADASEILDL